MLFLQMPTPLADGGFVAGVGIGVGFAATGLAWAFKLVKGAGTNGSTKQNEGRAFELRVRADARLEELQGISKQLAITQDLAVHTLERLTDRLEEHDARVLPALRLVEQTHERVAQLHRRLMPEGGA